MPDAIYGKLEAFCETGTEGIVWSVIEEGKTGYDALHCLQDDDHLTIMEADGTILWAGFIDLTYKMRTHFWTRGAQRNVEHEEWSAWFHAAKRATLVLKAPSPQND